VKGWGATTGDLAVWCWGTDSAGELGNGAIAPSPYAVPAVGLVQSAVAGVRSVQSGWYHTCAETVVQTAPSTSSVICWGRSPGNGSASQQDAFVSVPPLTGLDRVVGFSAGFDDTCALVILHPGAAGTRAVGAQVYCWGRNADDQLGSVGPDTPVPQLVSSLPLSI
jgi:hypothetical protein